MSCRSTRGGAVALRLARAYSGLPERDVQALFHSLKREGAGLADPTDDAVKWWRERQRALVDHSDWSGKQRAKAEHDLLRSADEHPDGALFHAWERIELRSRQEAVIRSVESAVDVAPPGSQADRYEFGSDGRPARVWYASYGSNMSRDRFLTYISGGVPEGTAVGHPGSRDGTLPDGDVPLRFPGRMHFAYASQRWDGGGVAFIDSDTSGHVLGRAYRISAEQFDDVVAQENGYPPSAGEPVPLVNALRDGRVVIPGRGPYRTLLHIGDYEGAPVVTFTGSFTARESLLEASALDRGEDGSPVVASNEPSENYMRMMGSGLAETFAMTEHQQADYLRGAGGAELWPRRLLLQKLRTPPTRPAAERPLFSQRETGRAPAAGTVGSKGDRKPPKKPATSTVWASKRCSGCGSLGHDLHACPFLKRNRLLRQNGL